MILEPEDFSGKTDMKFSFGGGTREQIIQGLFKLIEGVADGRVLVQGVELRQETLIDDYAMRYFVLKYAECENPTIPEEGKIQISTYEDFIKHIPEGFGTLTKEQK